MGGAFSKNWTALGKSHVQLVKLQLTRKLKTCLARFHSSTCDSIIRNNLIQSIASTAVVPTIIHYHPCAIIHVICYTTGFTHVVQLKPFKAPQLGRKRKCRSAPIRDEAPCGGVKCLRNSEAVNTLPQGISKVQCRGFRVAARPLFRHVSWAFSM